MVGGNQALPGETYNRPSTGCPATLPVRTVRKEVSISGFCLRGQIWREAPGSLCQAGM